MMLHTQHERRVLLQTHIRRRRIQSDSPDVGVVRED